MRPGAEGHVTQGEAQGARVRRGTRGGGAVVAGERLALYHVDDEVEEDDEAEGPLP